jgi:hypothetical protein
MRWDLRTTSKPFLPSRAVVHARALLRQPMSMASRRSDWCVRRGNAGKASTVIVLGHYFAIRTSVDIARLEAPGFAAGAPASLRCRVPRSEKVALAAGVQSSLRRLALIWSPAVTSSLP